MAAGLIARETGVKGGERIRVLPFDYVANDAAEPATPLATTVTVGPDGIVRELALGWGTWTYAVAYRKLGKAPAIRAPANAVPMREWRKSARG